MFTKEIMERIEKGLREKKAKRILIQVPEGLKTSVQQLSEYLDRKGIESIISIEPSFGSCDLMDHEARLLACDLLLHVGHSDFGLRTELPVIYEHYPMDFDVEELLRKHMNEIKKFRRIGLVTTIQFVHLLEKTRKILEKNGMDVHTASSVKGIEGQMLGCDHSAALPMKNKVDCYLSLGSGRFHPLGLQAAVDKPVLFLDFERGSLENLYQERNKMIIKRELAKEKAAEANVFGILVSTKRGQMNTAMALKIKKHLESKGRKTVILVAGTITPEKLLGLKLDVLVDTACPRLADDRALFRKTILRPEEALSL